MTKTTTRTPKLDEARARAEAARRLAAAMDALAGLDLGDQLARLAEVDRKVEAGRRSIERATREVATARSTRRAVVGEIRSLVAATGASPQQAADLLGLPISLCQAPSGTDDDRDNGDNEDDDDARDNGDNEDARDTEDGSPYSAPSWAVAQ